MEFSWGPDPIPRDYASDSYLYMSGSIRPGDYQRFRTFMLENLEKYKASSRVVVLESNGGNVFDALKIAELLRSMHVTVEVLKGKCTSSCFYLYLSGNRRIALQGSLGIHRAYFDQTYFKGLSPEEARRKYLYLTESVKLFLNSHNVPQYLIERMNGASSTDTYWLTGEDIYSLGMRQPWFEEMLIAKCGLDIPLEKRYRSTPKDSPLYADLERKYDANQASVIQCEYGSFGPELNKLRTILQL